MPCSRAGVAPYPGRPGPLIGRARELSRLATLLADPGCRLITVTGVGGVGKTRLALEAAAAANPCLEGEVVFVDLAAVSAPELFLDAIGRPLGLLDGGPIPWRTACRRSWQAARILLLLDNFEHLVSCAPLVDGLLADCPGLTLLVTSRRRSGCRAKRK